MTMGTKENAAPTAIGNGANTSYNTAGYITDLTALARKLGGEVVGRDAILVPGPGHTDDDRSLSVKFDPTIRDGFMVHSFAGDEPYRCRDHVRAAMLSGATRYSAPPPPPKLNNPDGWKITWGRGLHPRGTLVEAYLKSRMLELPSEEIRLHPRLWMRFEERHTPGMMTLYRNVITLEPQGVHRTFLNEDGTRGEKKCLGSVRYAAAMFGDTRPGHTLGIAEGIETALSAKKLFSGCPTVWSCISAGNIERFPVLDGVQTLVIFADNDPAGIAAAERCGERWLAMGRNVQIIHPTTPGADWNNVLRGDAE